MSFGLLPESSGPLNVSSGLLGGGSGSSQRDEAGRLRVEGLSKLLIDNLEGTDVELRQELDVIASDARHKGRLEQAEMKKIILTLCRQYYLTLPVLCQLLDRKPDPLRKRYLKPLVEHGELTLAFPTRPTHPMQAYTTME
ncbi:hypothetical protein [Nitrosomonas sp. Nm166]|uniref:hypothetical protein n=1 Tax=Nitrosomonas sp. Nm166 TaxID=1881054 RepID=UPI0008EE721A|nr:hypothetical protein [Nitrosomonas sp. Nm166]SFE57491.1 hypothetical protein SAMN05428977_10213 [Nitrosomonas sp. Nm166]